MTPRITVTALTTYSDKAATDIGRLLPYLDSEFSGDPVPRERLERIINSEFHEQLVVIREDKIIGIATMMTLLEPGFDKLGYLGAFVVDPTILREGIGSSLWDGILAWCRDNGITIFEFKTETYREAAIKFYDKKGATRVEDAILYTKTVEQRF